MFKFITVVSTYLLSDTLLKEKIHVDERSLFYELQFARFSPTFGSTCF